MQHSCAYASLHITQDAFHDVCHVGAEPSRAQDGQSGDDNDDNTTAPWESRSHLCVCVCERPRKGDIARSVTQHDLQKKQLIALRKQMVVEERAECVNV